MLHYAFDNVGLERVIAKLLCRRVLQKSGMKRVCSNENAIQKWEHAKMKKYGMYQMVSTEGIVKPDTMPNP